jgi:ABC-type branched-subunit amino acid transport system substrate-binding protein
MIVLALLMPNKGLAQEQNQPPTINIGLLVPDSSNTLLIRAAEEAVAKANKLGGYQNQDFKLVVRSAEGPWGTGSKESVALVYEDDVYAIVGSLDGRNAHLAEQVSAKSHLSYLEAYATDPTLSQAFVPWFMRVVPNDDQQAEALVELIIRNGGGKIGILSTDTYDAGYAVNSLAKMATSKTGNTPLVISVDSLGKQEQRIVEKIRKSAIVHLIVPFDAALNNELLISLKKEIPPLQLYGTLHFTMGAEIRKIPWRGYEGMYMVSAGPVWIGNDYLFHPARSGSAHDAVDLVIKAIKKVGTDREAIKNYLLEINYDEGVTGPITFDEMGNRTRKPVLTRIVQGERIFIPYR